MKATAEKYEVAVNFMIDHLLMKNICIEVNNIVLEKFLHFAYLSQKMLHFTAQLPQFFCPQSINDDQSFLSNSLYMKASFAFLFAKALSVF